MILTIILIYQNYFIQFPQLQSDSFQYALNQAIPDVIKSEGKYNQILISNQADGYQSYMFYLFHSHYDPVKYQNLGGTVSGGYAENHLIGKYIFRPVIWEKDKMLKNTLILAASKEIPDNVNGLKTYSYLNSVAGVKLIETAK
jgi:hypothetical protein